MPLVRRRRNRSPGSTSLRDHYERTAVGLLEALSPISGLIAANHDPGTFIYRGVGSSTYQLVPAAFRGRRLPFPDRRPVSRRTFHNQIWAEIVYFSEYCRVADSRGLRIPEDSQAFRSILQDLNGPDYIDRLSAGGAVWPPDGILSALGLAQHYGVPTRLLDWTRSPFVAAYFAATSSLQSPTPSRRAAIWAFDVDRLLLNTFNELDLPESIRLVNAPGFDIPNLQAQQGLFMVMRGGKFRKSATFRVRPYDELLTSEVLMDSSGPVLYRFTFPGTEAPDLLRLLSYLGVDGSAIFPGQKGAAQAVSERLLWPPPGSKYEDRVMRAARRRFGAAWK